MAKRTNSQVLEASTSEVYGDPSVSPLPETYWGHLNLIGIRSSCDEGKRAAETLFFDYYRQLGLDIRVARIFNTYLLGMEINDGRVVGNFIVKALENRELTAYGDGAQTRGFFYVNDLVSGLISSFFADGVYEPIKFDNPEPVNVGESAKEIIEKTNSKSQIIFQTILLDEPKRREPDIGTDKNILGLAPKISRSLELDKTIEYFRKELAS